jgi:dTDP-4-dehydrorhamnose 3,5-epimerase
MEFRPGPIDGVLMKPLRKFRDSRGWLCELFRQDEVPAEYQPAMAYISATEAGVMRGPHEHIHQADCFCFLGPSNFEVYLWDNRPDSPSYLHFQRERAGADRPLWLVIPPGVVHAYRNVGEEPGFVINCPNRLYKGPARAEPVDEIRHEDNPDSAFRIPAEASELAA